MKFHRGQDNFITDHQIQPNISHSQVSSAKYSDISSQYLRRAKQIYDLEIDFTPAKDSSSYINMKSYRKFESPNIAVDKEIVHLDSEEFIQFFQDDDSILSLNKIFPQAQFRENAKELGIKPIQRQSIVYKFYKEKNKIPTGEHPYNNKYYVDYLQWKQHDEPIPNSTDFNPLKKKKTNQQIARDTIVEKELELKAYKSKILEQNQEKSLNQMRKNLRNISDQYQSKLKSVLDSRWDNSPLKNYQTNAKQRKVERNRQLGFTKIQYPIMKAVQIQQKLIGPTNEQKKWKNINHISYVDIIKRPPSKIRSDTIQVPCEKKVSSQEEDFSKREEKLSWKLNIEDMLKIPHKQFLLFYNEYERKIVALCSPEELKRIRKYRNEALQKEQALLKLKSKIATHGQQLLSKLSQEKRRQLFQLLYQDQVQKQKQQNVMI